MPSPRLPDQEKVAWLERVDRETRKLDPRIVQVMASVNAVHEVVMVANSEGELAADVRPLVRFNVSVLVEQNGRREQGYAGCGGRYSLADLVAERPAACARRGGAAPGAGQSRGDSGAGGRDDGRAGPGLARRAAARGDRSRTRGRFQSQGHIRICRTHRRACRRRRASPSWTTARCRGAVAR